MLNLKKGDILTSNDSITLYKVLALADGAYLLDNHSWWTDSEIEANFILPKEKWVPKRNIGYYYFNSLLELEYDVFEDLTSERELLKMGNCFETRAEAQKVVEEIKKLLNK